MKAKNTAYLFIRILVGINFFTHGLVRLPKINAFSNWMVTTYESTFLPKVMVQIFSQTVPYIELLLGAALFLGIYTYKTTIAIGVLLTVLLFGACLLEKWDWVAFQMIYALCAYLLISRIEDNTYKII